MLKTKEKYTLLELIHELEQLESLKDNETLLELKRRTYKYMDTMGYEKV